MTVRQPSPHRTTAVRAGAVQAGVILAGIALSSLLPAAAWADCNVDMAALAAKRSAASALLDANKKAHAGKLDPVSACPQLKALAAAQGAMVSYMTTNKDWCALPDKVVADSAAAQAQIGGFAVKACGMIAKMKQMQVLQAQQAAAAAQQQQAQVPALKLPAGPLVSGSAGSPDARRGSPQDLARDLPDAALRRWPTIVRPYAQLARWDRPIGWQLLLAPCWWGTALVADAVGAGPNLAHLALFAVGAIAMRGAGSTGNDIVDRDIDRAVERTRGRPWRAGA